MSQTPADWFNLIAYGAGTLWTLLLFVLLLISPRQLNRVVTLLVISMSVFFLAKLTYILFALPQTLQVQVEMTETFFWLPTLYVLAFFIPDLRLALRAAVTSLGLLLFISVLYALTGGAQHLSILLSLAELNLANATLIVITSFLGSFRERYARSVSSAATLERLAITDYLTGLPNRAALLRHLDQVIARGQPFSVLFVDLDGFKAVNDTFGHTVGDAVIRAVAARLEGFGPAEQWAARLGGDEFVLVLPHLPEDALRQAERLLTRIEQPVAVADQQVSVSASIGITHFPEAGQAAETLIQHADTAMYVVKASGKRGVHLYSPVEDAEIERRQRLERSLRRAIEQRALFLQYQPIFDLRSNRAVKVEALLRWTDAEFGAVSPAEFIPIAEASGLILSLGSWVLEEACRQAQEWRAVHGAEIVVCVNVSPLQFIRQDLQQVVTQVLRETGLPPAALELEITEHAVIRKVETVRASLMTLQALGVRVSIDDFGTGYSSLSYLRDLPINSVKIDRSFTQDLGRPRHAPQFALALIEAVISIAETLELEVVAEGIETLKQHDALRDLGCHLGQGYALARPLFPEDAVKVMLPGNPVETALN